MYDNLGVISRSVTLVWCFFQALLCCDHQEAEEAFIAEVAALARVPLHHSPDPEPSSQEDNTGERTFQWTRCRCQGSPTSCGISGISWNFERCIPRQGKSGEFQRSAENHGIEFDRNPPECILQLVFAQIHFIRFSVSHFYTLYGRFFHSKANCCGNQTWSIYNFSELKNDTNKPERNENVLGYWSGLT